MLENRLDTGALFENYLVSERLKKLRYEKSYAKSYFWRSTTKQEIDYIEDIDGQLTAVEFKWNPKRKAALPLSFSRSYADTDFKVITRDNYESFLLQALDDMVEQGTETPVLLVLKHELS